MTFTTVLFQGVLLFQLGRSCRTEVAGGETCQESSHIGLGRPSLQWNTKYLLRRSISAGHIHSSLWQRLVFSWNWSPQRGLLFSTVYHMVMSVAESMSCCYGYNHELSQKFANIILFQVTGFCRAPTPKLPLCLVDLPLWLVDCHSDLSHLQCSLPCDDVAWQKPVSLLNENVIAVNKHCDPDTHQSTHNSSLPPHPRNTPACV